MLAELNVPCEFFGTLAAGAPETAVIEKDFEAKGVAYGASPRIPGVTCPNSMVLVSAATGSRTIVHTNKDLPEPTAEQFRASVALDKLDWIHFEGRNKEEVKLMADFVRQWRKDSAKPVISVEVEKVRNLHMSLLRR